MTSESQPTLVTLEWQHAPDFLECFEDGPVRSIRKESSIDDLPEVGSLCLLRLKFIDRGNEFQLHGTLASYDNEVATFELLAEERMRHEIVLVAARGESLPYRRRRHSRSPCLLLANVVSQNGERIAARVTTFGAGGVHLSLENVIDCEERIDMTITLADNVSIELAGRVTSSIAEGPKRGISVEFLFRSAAQRDEVASIAAKLEPGI